MFGSGPLAEARPTALLELKGSAGLKADIAPAHGGDLAGLSVWLGGRWVQLLYRGNDYSPTKDWTGKGPLLWPATGRNFGGGPTPRSDSGSFSWVMEGKTYPMPIHGFARDLPWDVVKRKRDRVVLTLTDTPETRRDYPFGFKLTTDYRLVGDSLVIRQTVRASSSNRQPMPFSIGNHLTFNMPLIPGARVEDVVFRSPGRKRILLDGSGKPTGSTMPVDYRASSPLVAINARTAVSLGDYPAAEAWMQLSDPAGLTIRVSHVESQRPPGDPVLFNLWGDLQAGFYAPEPWVGKQNSLASGDGTIKLDPGRDFDWAITIKVTPTD